MCGTSTFGLRISVHKEQSAVAQAIQPATENPVFQQVVQLDFVASPIEFDCP
jgi:hypothetical protein